MTVATPASGGAVEPSAAPRQAPLLDRDKGERAVEAYRKFRRSLCAELSALRGRPVVATARLEEVGLDGIGEDVLCGGVVSARGRALASGALLEAGADEVLLQVETGRMATQGSSLALMRDRGKGYRFVRHMLASMVFEARLRLVTPAARDVLFMCQSTGLGGVYPGSCGFFDRGSFRDPVDPGPGDDLGLFRIVEPCGRAASVSVGKVDTQEDRLHVELVVQNGVMARGRGDAQGACSELTKNTRRAFTMQYKFDGKQFRLATPTPKAVRDVLDLQQ